MKTNPSLHPQSLLNRVQIAQATLPLPKNDIQPENHTALCHVEQSDAHNCSVPLNTAVNNLWLQNDLHLLTMQSTFTLVKNTKMFSLAAIKHGSNSTHTKGNKPFM